MIDDYEDLRAYMARPDVRAAVARQSEPEIPFELIEAAGRVYTLPEPEEPPEVEQGSFGRRETMARGHYRKQRYVVRLGDGRGIGASSETQVKKLLNEHEGSVQLIETETGDVTVEQFLKEGDDEQKRCSAN